MAPKAVAKANQGVSPRSLEKRRKRQQTALRTDGEAEIDTRVLLEEFAVAVAQGQLEHRQRGTIPRIMCVPYLVASIVKMQLMTRRKNFFRSFGHMNLDGVDVPPNGEWGLALYLMRRQRSSEFVDFDREASTIAGVVCVKSNDLSLTLMDDLVPYYSEKCAKDSKGLQMLQEKQAQTIAEAYDLAMYYYNNPEAFYQAYYNDPDRRTYRQRGRPVGASKSSEKEIVKAIEDAKAATEEKLALTSGAALKEHLKAPGEDVDDTDFWRAVDGEIVEEKVEGVEGEDQEAQAGAPGVEDCGEAQAHDSAREAALTVSLSQEEVVAAPEANAEPAAIGSGSGTGPPGAVHIQEPANSTTQASDDDSATVYPRSSTSAAGTVQQVPASPGGENVFAATAVVGEVVVGTSPPSGSRSTSRQLSGAAPDEQAAVAGPDASAAAGDSSGLAGVESGSGAAAEAQPAATEGAVTGSGSTGGEDGGPPASKEKAAGGGPEGDGAAGTTGGEAKTSPRPDLGASPIAAEPPSAAERRDPSGDLGPIRMTAEAETPNDENSQQEEEIRTPNGTVVLVPRIQDPDETSERGGAAAVATSEHDLGRSINLTPLDPEFAASLPNNQGADMRQDDVVRRQQAARKLADLGQHDRGFKEDVLGVSELMKSYAEDSDEENARHDPGRRREAFLKGASDLDASPRAIQQPFSPGSTNYGEVRPELGELATTEGAPTQLLTLALQAGESPEQLPQHEMIVERHIETPNPEHKAWDTNEQNPFVVGMGHYVTGYPVEGEQHFYDGRDLMERFEHHRVRQVIDYVARRYFKNPETEKLDRESSFHECFGQLESILLKQLDTIYGEMSNQLKRHGDTIPDIMKCEQKVFANFRINRVSDEHYDDLIEKLHRARFNLFKRKEYEIANQWEKPFTGPVSKYRPQSVNYAEELGNDNEYVLEFRHEMSTLYAKHTNDFSNQARRRLGRIDDILAAKGKAPQVKSVLKSFDDRRLFEIEQGKQDLRSWMGILGDGDPAILAYGGELLSPRTFQEWFYPCAEKHKEALLQQEERHLTTGEIFEAAEHLNTLLSGLGRQAPALEKWVDETRVQIPELQHLVPKPIVLPAAELTANEKTAAMPDGYQDIALAEVNLGERRAKDPFGANVGAQVDPRNYEAELGSSGKAAPQPDYSGTLAIMEEMAEGYEFPPLQTGNSALLRITLPTSDEKAIRVGPASVLKRRFRRVFNQVCSDLVELNELECLGFAREPLSVIIRVPEKAKDNIWDRIQTDVYEQHSNLMASPVNVFLVNARISATTEDKVVWLEDEETKQLITELQASGGGEHGVETYAGTRW